MAKRKKFKFRRLKAHKRGKYITGRDRGMADFMVPMKPRIKLWLGRIPKDPKELREFKKELKAVEKQRAYSKRLKARDFFW